MSAIVVNDREYLPCEHASARDKKKKRKIVPRFRARSYVSTLVGVNRMWRERERERERERGDVFQKMVGRLWKKSARGMRRTHKGSPDPIDANILTMHRPSTLG